MSPVILYVLNFFFGENDRADDCDQQKNRCDFKRQQELSEHRLTDQLRVPDAVNGESRNITLSTCDAATLDEIDHVEQDHQAGNARPDDPGRITLTRFRTEVLV